MSMFDTNGIINFLENNTFFKFIYFLLTPIGIVLSFYFYYKSRKFKRPVYIVKTLNLVKEKIQKIETVQILYKGEKVDNLSISKIALWNEGKETISTNDVANSSPIKINIKDGLEILEAEIIYQKNISNDFKIEINEDYKFLLVKFDFFDFEEGVVLKIFHTGSSSSDLFLSGTVKSVKKITRKEINYLPTIFNKILLVDNSLSKKSKLRIIGWSSIFMGILVILGFPIMMYQSDEMIEKKSSSIITTLLIGIPYLYLGYKTLKKYIPKDFNIIWEDI
jgi:hypothetical protein